MPHDLGVTGPRDQRKDEYIGKRSLFMPVAKDRGRKQLVGLERRPAARRRCRPARMWSPAPARRAVRSVT